MSANKPDILNRLHEKVLLSLHCPENETRLSGDFVCDGKE